MLDGRFLQIAIDRTFSEAMLGDTSAATAQSYGDPIVVGPKANDSGPPTVADRRSETVNPEKAKQQFVDATPPPSLATHSNRPLLKGTMTELVTNERCTHPLAVRCP